jgi:hypothetical protein
MVLLKLRCTWFVPDNSTAAAVAATRLDFASLRS